MRGLRLFVTLLACTAVSAWTPKATHHNIKSLGIIAALGDTCMFERVTDSPFDWLAPPQASFLEISDWGIDDEVAAAISKFLGAHYRLQSIAIEHQDFDSWTWDSLAKRIRELPVLEKPVDAYLAVLRDWHNDEIGSSTHQIGGVGLYRGDFGRGGHRLGAFASYRLALLDPDTGNVITESAATLTDDRLPWLSVSPTLWPRTQNNLTDRQRRELQSDFLTLIDTTLPRALDNIGLHASS